MIARFGLRVTLFAGLAIQVAALVMLSFVSQEWIPWVSVAYVMTAQALVGTLLSGVMYLAAGLPGCLWVSTGFVIAAAALTLFLPVADRPAPAVSLKAVAAQGSD